MNRQEFVRFCLFRSTSESFSYMLRVKLAAVRVNTFANPWRDLVRISGPPAVKKIAGAIAKIV